MMVKLTGPGLGNKAGGSLAGQLTFSEWKGKAYLKKHRKPKQPRTGPQVSIRAMMAFLSKQWAAIAAVDQATWQDLAAADEISPFNAYQRENLSAWREALTPSKTYPPARTLFPGAFEQITAAGGVRHVDLETWLSFVVDNNWSILLFHGTGGSPDPVFANLVHVFHVEDLLPHLWTHTPLAAGTHYYRVDATSIDGNSDYSEPDFASAVVT